MVTGEVIFLVPYFSNNLLNLLITFRSRFQQEAENGIRSAAKVQELPAKTFKLYVEEFQRTRNGMS